MPIMILICETIPITYSIPTTDFPFNYSYLFLASYYPNDAYGMGR